MRKVIVTEFVSLDGVYQAPGSPEEDTEGGFKHGGWQLPYFDADAGRFISEAYAATGALLLGRVTYQIFAAYWPSAPEDNPLAKQMNSMPKYVASTTLNEVKWNNSKLIKENVAEEVAKLKQQPGSGNLAVVGSGRLAQTLMQHNLVDEYDLWVHPIVLGSGKRLFVDGIGSLNLRLVDTKTTSSGIVILTYRPERKGGPNG
ncbi:MAG: dihydrofolate reductase family protein [Chloroflexi bacterium]|nr:dihydrofolate reductase family protein [Chloroflexota bacterium]